MTRRSVALSLLIVTTISLMMAAPGLASLYSVTTTIPVPGVPPATGTWSFDIGWLDAASQQYYLADRTKKGIDIVDAATHTFITTVGGFVGATGVTATSGPNGVVAVPAHKEVWAGDGDSTVKVIDLTTRAVVATIPTGGTKRADEIAYDDDDDLIIVANDADTPVFLTIVSVPTRKIVAKVLYPNATAGMEQPVYDKAHHRFLQAVPATTANPGGEIDAIDPRSGAITAIFPLQNCGPHGIAIGPSNHLLVGCGTPPTAGSQLTTQILDLSTGKVVSVVPQVGGADEVWYNPGDRRYYIGAVTNTANGLQGGPAAPVLGIIDAVSNTWITNVPFSSTINRPIQSIAVNPANNEAFVPFKASGIQIVKDIGGVGGQHFTLTHNSGARGVTLSWLPGTSQTGYTLLRTGNVSGLTSKTLDASATTTTDLVLSADTSVCYQLIANASPPKASDLLCDSFGTETGFRPATYSIQLNQSNTASLYWSPNTIATGYVLNAVGTSRVQTLGPSALAAADNTGGSTVCYTLTTSTGTPIGGVTNALCATPGRSTVQAAGAPTSEADAATALQAAVSDVQRLVSPSTSAPEGSH